MKTETCVCVCESTDIALYMMEICLENLIKCYRILEKTGTENFSLKFLRQQFTSGW